MGGTERLLKVKSLKLPSHSLVHDDNNDDGGLSSSSEVQSEIFNIIHVYTTHASSYGLFWERWAVGMILKELG